MVSASIGVAVAADHDEPAADLILHADAALYEAKRGGGARSTSATATCTDARPIAGSTSSATCGGRSTTDELQLVYQPIFELATGRAVRVEALLRWTHPQLGAIAAPAIVAVGRAHRGLIRDLGTWVIRTACEQLSQWNEVRRRGQLHLRQRGRLRVHRPRLLPRGRGRLHSGRHRARSTLCLEITESVLIDDVPGALAAFDGLKRVGVQLALDDFGTGYSSLSYLKRFPVDIVKIDQSFVAGIPAEPLDEAIVTAVIGLAHDIGMTVVAEGVEDPRQHAAVSKLGCDMAQGFLFARPTPAAAVAEHLKMQLSG